MRAYIAKRRKEKQRPKLYIPLEFNTGNNAQADWGEGIAIIAGEQVRVQLSFMRLCYSRRLFVMAFLSQEQGAFFEGHAKLPPFPGTPSTPRFPVVLPSRAKEIP